jgi:hypothetical protein
MDKCVNEDHITVNLIREAVEDKGCQISAVDLKKLRIEIDGPDELIGDCARAVADIV